MSWQPCSPALSINLHKGRRLYTPLLLQPGLSYWPSLWSLLKSSVASFLQWSPPSRPSQPAPRQGLRPPSSLCHTPEPLHPSRLWPLTLSPCTLLPQQSPALSDFCLPHHLAGTWLQRQLHSPQAIQQRRQESKPCDTKAYVSLSLLALSYGTEECQKCAGMGHRPGTAHISSMNYKEEKLNWVVVGSFQNQPL